MHADGIEHVQIRTSDVFVTLRLLGAKVTDGPVNLTFLVPGLAQARTAATVLLSLAELPTREPRWSKRSRRLLLFRDALIALDGSTAGSTYRNIAVAIVGPRRAAAAWTSPSRSLKDRMRRVLAKGRHLRDGGYLQLIG